jgi:hypothetical protein
MKKTEKPKFTIKVVNNSNVLFNDHGMVPCIYKNPTVLPHPQIAGQVIINNPACSDHCPMFNLTPGLFGKLKFECTKHEIDIYTETPINNML